MEGSLKLLLVTVVEVPISFSPFMTADCMLFSHFSSNDFVSIAFLDLVKDLDIQIEIPDMTSLFSRQYLS